jgi:dTDP-4-amino-4,6-dideoxygalactose transaminase
MQVTKTFLPPFEEYMHLLDKVWQSEWITNNGQLLQQLEAEIKSRLKLSHLLICNNGTIVLQMALKALGISREVITTPFSYVATVNALLWEGCRPVFVDIDPKSFCIDVSKIEAAITSETEAILATHVYGFACNVQLIEAIARKYNLKVIYDAAHAFGVNYLGSSLLSYGDISTCSFHATKVFHMAEGGCVTSPDPDIMQQLMLYRQFGHVYDEYYSIGINSKSSELNAAMGLAVLPHFEAIVSSRRQAVMYYMSHLPETILPNGLLAASSSDEWNFSYMPVQFSSQANMVAVKDALTKYGINSRRYFWPALHKLPFITSRPQLPVAEHVANTILCLPLFHEMRTDDLETICRIVKQTV